MLFYYCITILANVVAVVLFYNYINITELSILPLFLIALMAFQAPFFKNEKIESGFRTNYNINQANLTAEEENQMFGNASKFMFATIPWMLPFIFFFPSPAKALSFLMYLIGLIGGLLVYRFKNKCKIAHRIKTEDKEG